MVGACPRQNGHSGRGRTITQTTNRRGGRQPRDRQPGCSAGRITPKKPGAVDRYPRTNQSAASMLRPDIPLIGELPVSSTTVGATSNADRTPRAPGVSPGAVRYANPYGPV